MSTQDPWLEKRKSEELEETAERSRMKAFATIPCAQHIIAQHATSDACSFVVSRGDE
jgi:hypothetical protein